MESFVLHCDFDCMAAFSFFSLELGSVPIIFIVKLADAQPQTNKRRSRRLTYNGSEKTW